jgi:hypothetical protein
MTDIVISELTIIRTYDDGGLETVMNAYVADRKGKLFYADATTGKAIVADASAAGTLGNLMGLAMNAERSSLANESVTLLRHGEVFFGVDALAALDFGDPIYASDTAGAIADAAGTVSVIVGYVIPVVRESGAIDKVAVIDTRHLATA